MADHEVAVTVDHSENQESQRSATDNKVETTEPASTEPIEGRDRATKRRWLCLNKMFDPKGKFLLIWNNVFVASCVFAVSFDPLFFYIPIINEKKKCVYFDTPLKAIALVLRLLADHFYIADIIIRILTSVSETKSSKAPGVPKTEGKDSKGKISVKGILALAKKRYRLYIMIDILAVLPIPQVLGALWYLFAIEREMDCWYSVCQRHKGCEFSTFSCSERRDKLAMIPLLKKECPINLPKEMQGKPFDFGIFADAIDSGLVHLTDFPSKFLNCFWWGLQNLSSLGQNLHTSTYAWENLFAVFISIIGLLLFIYLIGNLQTYLQFATTRSEKLRRKMKTKNLEVELWLSRKGLPGNLKAVIMDIIQQKLEQNKDVQVENILTILPSAHSKYIKRYLRLATLKKVPMLQTMGVKLLKAICEHLEPVDYPEDSCILKEGERLDKMIFITHGTVQTYKTNGKGGKIGSTFLEKGDFYGAEELLNWASKFSPFEDLPTSTRMVKPVTKVEAFSLSADDLKSTSIKYWWNFTKNKELSEFDITLLEEFAVSSIEKEIRRRRQGKKKPSIGSLNKLDTNQGSLSQKLQKIISKVMRDQLPSPVGALAGK